MTIPLQPTRDSFTLQSRTAPVREPLQPSGHNTRRRNWCERAGVRDHGPQDTGSASQTQPFVSARVAAGRLCQGDLAPGFPAHPQRQSCPRVQTEPPWGALGLHDLGNWRLLCKGLAEQSLRDALHATTATMWHPRCPMAVEILYSEILFKLHDLHEAQANCARRLT